MPSRRRRAPGIRVSELCLGEVYWQPEKEGWTVQELTAAAEAYTLSELTFAGVYALIVEAEVIPSWWSWWSSVSTSRIHSVSLFSINNAHWQ